MKQFLSTEQFKTFGQLLLFLRKRARFTQAELGRAVGYSREQISRLESDQRLPDVVAVRALFITALGLEEQPQLAQQLVQLAEQAHHAVTDRPSVTRRLVRKKLTQLPAPMFKLIGRVEELATVQTMMGQEASRLYTLLGPPGVGKTRLALALGWQLQPLFEDGVVWVDLTAVSDAAAVATVIRQRLKLSEPTATTPTAELEQLAEGLGARHLLLILDNFEQLLEARLMLSDLLAAVAGLTILVTSRVPLHIYGEHEIHIEPFPVSNLQAGVDLQLLRDNPAVALFLARAQAVQPNLQLTADNASLISAICARLDGLPLALELAAGQLQQQTLTELWEQLNLQPLMLNHGPLDRSQRQQSLRGAIAWSFTRLPDAQRQLFVRLAVFSGGFTKAAVEAVCQSEQLSELVDANLVQVKDERLGMRHFGLLETIREFALELFLQTAEIDEIYKRHAEYILGLTKAAREAYSTPELGNWQTRLLADYDNIVTALTWTCSHQPQLGLEICANVWRFWYLWGRYKEGGRWLAQFLELMPASTLWRARVLRGRGVLKFRSGFYQQALPFFAESLQIYQQLGDKFGIATIHMEFGNCSEVQYQLEEAAAYYETAFNFFRQLDDFTHLSWSLGGLVSIAVTQKKPWETIEPLQHEMIAYARQAKDPRHLAWILAIAADQLRLNGRLVRAQSHLAEMESLAKEVNDLPAVAYAFLRQGHLFFLQADYVSAIDRLQEAFFTAWETGTHSYVGQALCLWGMSVCEQAVWESGVQLIAAAQTHNPQVQERLAAEQTQLDNLLETARQLLGQNQYDTLWQRGRQLSVEEIVEQFTPYKVAT